MSDADIAQRLRSTEWQGTPFINEALRAASAIDALLKRAEQAEAKWSELSFENSELRSEVARLKGALSHCKSVFNKYGDAHFSAGKKEKAIANYDHAALCEKALAGETI